MRFIDTPLAMRAGRPGAGLVTCLVTCLVLASPLHAQSTADPLATAIESAWQRATAAAEAGGLAARAQAEQEAARRWSAGSPALELAARDDRWHRGQGEREREVGAAWPLWLPGQRAAAGAAADAAGASADAQWRAARLRLAGEVREAYWAAAAAAAERAAVQAQNDVLQRLAADVERRVASGDLARTDQLAAQGEWLASQVQAAQAADTLAAAQSHWQQLTGLPLPLIDAVAQPRPPFDEDRHPTLLLAQAAVAQARARLTLARQSRRQAPELAVGARQEIPGRGEPSQGSVQLRVRVPLGTAEGAREIASTQGDLDVAEAALRPLRERLRAEAALAQAALTSAAAQRALEAQRAAQLRERARLIERSFAAGESALAELLRALAAAGEAEAAHLRQQARFGAAQARLMTVSGVLP